MAVPSSYLGKIVNALLRLGTNGTESPDHRHNVGRLLGEAFMWDEVARYAKKQSDAVWEALEKEGVIQAEGLNPGEHVIAESPHFVCMAKISRPVRRFSADELAKMMKKEFKVPEPRTKELVELAKVPTKSTTTLSVAEKL